MSVSESSENHCVMKVHKACQSDCTEEDLKQGLVVESQGNYMPAADNVERKADNQVPEGYSNSCCHVSTQTLISSDLQTPDEDTSLHFAFVKDSLSNLKHKLESLLDTNELQAASNSSDKVVVEEGVAFHQNTGAIAAYVVKEKDDAEVVLSRPNTPSACNVPESIQLKALAHQIQKQESGSLGSLLNRSPMSNKVDMEGQNSRTNFHENKMAKEDGTKRIRTVSYTLIGVSDENGNDESVRDQNLIDTNDVTGKVVNLATQSQTASRQSMIKLLTDATADESCHSLNPLDNTIPGIENIEQFIRSIDSSDDEEERKVHGAGLDNSLDDIPTRPTAVSTQPSSHRSADVDVKALGDHTLWSLMPEQQTLQTSISNPPAMTISRSAVDRSRGRSKSTGGRIHSAKKRLWSVPRTIAKKARMAW